MKSRRTTTTSTAKVTLDGSANLVRPTSGRPFHFRPTGLTLRDGREAKVRIVGRVLSDNAAMLHVSRNVGFEPHLLPAEGEWAAELDLRPEQIARRGSDAPL